MRVKEGFIVELQHSEIDAWRNGLDGRRDFVSRLIGLDLDLAGIENDMRIGKDALAFNDYPGACHFRRGLLGPGLEKVRVANGGKDFHDRVFDDAGFGFSRSARGFAFLTLLSFGGGCGEGEEQKQPGKKILSRRRESHAPS